MGEPFIWLLAALGLGLLAAWQVLRRHAEAKRRAAATVARAAAEREARRQVELERAAAVRAQAAREAADQARADVEQAAATAALARASRARADAEQAAAAQAEAERAAAERQAADQAAPVRSNPAPVAATPPRAVKRADQTLVMVADDSKVVRVKTGRLLAQQQFQVCFANDGLDAVRQFQERVPDILITDVEMPGMDGFELTQHVRGNPLTARIPVIMITAADGRHRERADQVGVSVLLGKPFPEDELIAQIRRAVGQEAAPAEAAAANAALDALV